MHENQLVVTTATMAGLVRDQFPEWAGLPVQLVDSHGTVNMLFRLGDDLVARLPLEGEDPQGKRAELLAEMESARLLSTVSPVATPEPVGLGDPTDQYPLPWSIYRWIPGEIASRAAVSDTPGFARQLAGFVRAVRSLPTEGRIFEGTRRGGLLAQHDEYVAAGLRRSDGLIDTEALASLWTRLRSTPRAQPDTWTHGDLMPGNLLALDGRLAGVIDVGLFGVADPALDLQPAWNFFAPAARNAFRAALECEDDDWERGKGWAFAQAIGCLWYYRETNPVMSETARHTLQALLDEE